MDTIDFYNTDPEGYSDKTFGADMSDSRNRFIRYLSRGSRILDLGCGSGRDSKAFASMGFLVTPVDGSEGMCRVAEKNTGLKVRRLLFGDLDYERCFEGVWACSSLLHVPSEELPDILNKIFRALVPEGVLYMTFKKGMFEGIREGRYYTDMTCKSLTEFVDRCGMNVLESWESKQPDGNAEWVNAIVSV